MTCDDGLNRFVCDWEKCCYQ